MLQLLRLKHCSFQLVLGSARLHITKRKGNGREQMSPCLIYITLGVLTAPGGKTLQITG